MVKEASPFSVGAVLVNGLPTAIFPSRPYRRVIRSISLYNPTYSRAAIYRGTITAATLIATTAQGSDQQYTTPINLPSGQSLYVQWSDGASDLSNIRSVITWLEN